MSERVLHQFTEGAYIGDAVSDQAFLIQRWLRQLGFQSELYAERIQPELAERVLPARQYRPQASERCLIHHHAVGSIVADRLMEIGLPQILIYHNITPAEFFEKTDPALAEGLRRGRKQLQQMRSQTWLGLGDSIYNESELIALGYASTGVLPIVLDESRFAAPSNEALLAECDSGRPLLLFVGRFMPNKCQEDLIKLLYYLRRIQPDARLVLVGNTSNSEYVDWQLAQARDLGIESAVRITGHVSHEEMLTFYRTADLYVSMSEHEGFGKPLIESMYSGLPVLAYASSAVPDTLGGAGILFHRKDYEALAELVILLVEDERLRRRIIARQTERVRDFLEPRVRSRFEGFLHQLDLLPGVAST
jgi:glycosyltransferase involved in cell wall biosynthesis